MCMAQRVASASTGTATGSSCNGARRAACTYPGSQMASSHGCQPGTIRVFGAGADRFGLKHKLGCREVRIKLHSCAALARQRVVLQVMDPGGSLISVSVLARSRTTAHGTPLWVHAASCSATVVRAAVLICGMRIGRREAVATGSGSPTVPQAAGAALPAAATAAATDGAAGVPATPRSTDCPVG